MFYRKEVLKISWMYLVHYDLAVPEYLLRKMKVKIIKLHLKETFLSNLPLSDLMFILTSGERNEANKHYLFVRSIFRILIDSIENKIHPRIKNKTKLHPTVGAIHPCGMQIQDTVFSVQFSNWRIYPSIYPLNKKKKKRSS